MMSSVKLYKNIGLDPTFKKTIDFISKTKQIEWFNSKTYDLFDNVNYNKLQNTLKINTDVDFSTALQYTYCVIEELETTNNRRYFCFIDSVSLISVGVIEFNLVLDPIQTFMCEFTIGESMVNRKHMNRWGTGNTPKYTLPNLDNIATNRYSENIDTTFYQKVTQPSSVLPHAHEDRMYICLMTFTRTVGTAENTHEEVVTAVAPIGFTYDGNNIKHRFLFAPDTIENGETIHHRYPTIEEVNTSSLPFIFGIAPTDIISIAILPFISYELTGTVYEDNIVHYRFEDTSFAGSITNNNYGNQIDGVKYCPYMSVYTYMNTGNLSNYVEYDIDVSYPVKPSNGNTKNASHEPLLYKSPFVEYSICDGLGNIKLTLPDTAIINKENTVKVKTIFSVSTCYNMVYIGDEFASATNEGKSAIFEALYLPIISDNWLEYSLTSKDIDRQLVTNQNIQNAINNIAYTAYGGSLVASRGASGADSTARRAQNLGKAVPLAIGASVGVGVLTSINDAHYAWEEQKLNETKIQNKPNNLLYVSDSAGLINWDILYYKLVYSSSGTEIINNYYEKYSKYGYDVNKYTVPDIRSRKYFDYILTNGCIIEGSLNTVIKQEIAMIFDNGITIFHGDYTNTLEYPTYENIERTLM